VPQRNPVRQIFEKRKPFIIFHTHVIDRKVLNAAVAAGKSLEVDLSIDGKGEIYVGHPLSHYAASNLPPPNNLPLDTVLGEMKAAGLFLALDCKDVRVLPKAQEIIKEYGAENCIFHSWSDALILEPYLEKWDTVQPNWAGEELPHSEILKLRQATNVPMTLSCHRGLTRKRLQMDGDVIVDRIAEILDGNTEGLSFVLPPGEIVPMSAMQKLLEHRILPHIHVDEVPPEARPPIYLGWTNHLEHASDPKIFDKSIS
jgi:hypothetical protein